MMLPVTLGEFVWLCVLLRDCVSLGDKELVLDIDCVGVLELDADAEAASLPTVKSTPHACTAVI